MLPESMAFSNPVTKGSLDFCCTAGIGVFMRQNYGPLKRKFIELITRQNNRILTCWYGNWSDGGTCADNGESKRGTN